jgi:hypothetical protein
MSAFHFNPGAIPGIYDIEGRKAFAEYLAAEIKALGGRPKGSMGLDSLRKMRRELVAKKQPPEKEKPAAVTPASVAHKRK